MELKVIARARNGHTDKFGIPRQSRDDSPIVTRIIFEPEYRVREAIRGIEDFSHLWLLWGFSEVETAGESWSPTVRPPRLGGNKRVGVFATRSPYRPNRIGLTSVSLVAVENGELVVSGADLMNGTPIYDIKPYLSYSDSHEEAKNGFGDTFRDYRLQVEGERGEMDEETWRQVSYILSQDPRPGYQHDEERVYKIDFAGWRVSFEVRETTVIVKKVEKM